jgi:hypothetical protein
LLEIALEKIRRMEERLDHERRVPLVQSPRPSERSWRTEPSPGPVHEPEGSEHGDEDQQRRDQIAVPEEGVGRDIGH